MSRTLVAASSQYLDIATAVVTTTPLTMACWVNLTSVLAQGIMSVYDSGVNNQNRHDLCIRNAGSRPVARTTASDGTSNESGAPAIDMSTNTWYHLAGVFASATSRFCYRDGNAGTEGTTSKAPSTLNATALGGFIDTASTGFMGGMIMEAAVWDVALSAAEIAALATR